MIMGMWVVMGGRKLRTSLDLCDEDLLSFLAAEVPKFMIDLAKVSLPDHVVILVTCSSCHTGSSEDGTVFKYDSEAPAYTLHECNVPGDSSERELTYQFCYPNQSSNLGPWWRKFDHETRP